MITVTTVRGIVSSEVKATPIKKDTVENAEQEAKEVETLVENKTTKKPVK